jgi:alpha-1,2-mannosyltransferase
MDSDATRPPARWEKGGLAFFVAILFVLGAYVEMRSAFLSRRMGDLDVFLRAAWAVRNDEDPYAITSDNDWHYIYPPLYAILLTPLADPPRGADASGYLPYPVSVAIVYLINLASLFGGAHVLASALEERSADGGFQAQPRFCRRWWGLRLLPILTCMLPIAHTLMRGQVNLVVLATLCAALAGWIRGQSFRAGMWLALAICIKVIPAFLLVYPLWKRDGRGLLGCAVGVLIGIVIVPGVFFGPAKTVTHYETYGRVFFAPFLRLNNDATNKDEILGGVNSTESVGVRNALHNWMYPDPAHRPADMHVAAQIAFLVLGAVMTFLTLWPASASSIPVAYGFGGLIVLMAIFSPVCHSHYLLFSLPIVMSLLAGVWQNQTTLRVPWPLASVFVLFFSTMAIAYLPGMEILKDRCATLFATLPLWGIPIAQLWRGQQSRPVLAPPTRQAA